MIIFKKSMYINKLGNRENMTQYHMIIIIYGSK